MIARDLMTPNPVTVMPETTVAEAWDLMRELDIRHVPVVERGALVGMLSERDLARFDAARVLSAEGTEALRGSLATAVVKVMSPDVVTVEPDTGLSEIVELLVEHRIGAVPVVLSGTRQVVGIVSYIDVLRAVRDLLDED